MDNRSAVNFATGMKAMAADIEYVQDIEQLATIKAYSWLKEGKQLPVLHLDLLSGYIADELAPFDYEQRAIAKDAAQKVIDSYYFVLVNSNLFIETLVKG